jgi:hypothetical protein
MIAPQNSSVVEEHDDDLYDLVPDSPPPRKHQEYEYDADLAIGGTGIAMAPPVVKPVASPKRGGVGPAKPRVVAHRAVAAAERSQAVGAKVQQCKSSHRVKWIAIVIATLLVASIIIGLLLRMR